MQDKEIITSPKLTATMRLVASVTTMAPLDFYRQALQEGRSARDISRQLGINPGTVISHIRALGLSDLWKAQARSTHR